MRKRIFILIICCMYICVSIFSLVGCSENTNDNKLEEVNEEKEQVETKTQEAKQDNKAHNNSDANEKQNNDEADKNYKVEFVSEKERKTIEVPFNKSIYEAKVKPYKIRKDLSNIENLEQFKNLTDEQINYIIKNGFVVKPTSEEQIFYIYESNEYEKIPSFITTDSILQVYHVFYDYSLRTLENEKFVGILEQLTENMINKSIYLYNKAENEKIKNALLKNIAYFSVGSLTLEKDLPENLPNAAKELADAEYSLIKEQEGFEKSIIFPYRLDYSQYKPRGHYTRNENLQRYFKAMMWYGQVPFPFYVLDENRQKERAETQTLQALLIAYTAFLQNNDLSDIKLWENIYNPTNFYVGNADDLNLYHYKDLLIKVYGEEVDINELDNQDKLDRVYLEAKNLPRPKIQAKYTVVNTPVGKQFRFIGQRYIPDSEIIQELVEPIIRPIPSGLDVMGVLGSDRAYDIQININKENKKWNEYIPRFNKMRKQFSKIDNEKWRSNMYYGWLWTLRSLLRKFEEGYPSFMTNTSWEDKSLCTALGSWSELKHDTVLYGKQSGAECCGFEEPPVIKGYVEPNVEVYERLLWLTRYSRKNLTNRDILVKSLETKLLKFEDLLQFLIKCSVKQLRNEELTNNEYNKILTYGGLLESLTSSFAGDALRWFEITSETDKNMAIISDIHTIAPNEYGAGGYFEVGVGPAYEILVVVPINEKLYLTKGGVFSYYEFVNLNEVSPKKRLTDEEWQKMIKENKQPPQPKWMKSFISSRVKE